MNLILVDGHAIAYRSYYAFIKNPLTNSRGENTSALYGFTRVLLQILNHYNPEYLAVVFDSDKPTERHKLFPEYKAHRDKMPDDLARQVPVMHDLVEAFGISVYEISGYEADDIIATIARDASRKKMDVKIVTGDKDLFQILSDRIHLIRPGKGTNLSDQVGPEYLKERYSLTPDQITDFLALTGDSADNIPGVKGVGEKTALKLLNEFGSLEKILDNSNEIKAKSIRNKIKEGGEDALFSKNLIELIDVPEGFDLEDMKVKEYDVEKLTEMLLKLEFHGILKSIIPEQDEKIKKLDYSAVNIDELDDLVSYLVSAGEFVFDVETTSLNPIEAEVVGISFCAEEGKAFYLPVLDSDEDSRNGLLELDDESSAGIPIERVKEKLGPVLLNKEIKKAGHNIKYDLMVLKTAGIEVRGVSFDTMIASYCLDPSRRSHSLDNLSLEFCRHRMIAYKDLFEKGDKKKDIRKVPSERLKNYASEDSDFTLRLKNIFSEFLSGSGTEKLFNEIEMPLLFVLMRMEFEGVAIDRDQLKHLSDEISGKIKEVRDEIYKYAGEEFNINSNKQLQGILFDKLELPVIKKTKTGYSTNMEVLNELSSIHPVAKRIIDYRQLSKLSNTYIDSLPDLVNKKTGRIHTSFNQTVTATGRLSSSNPNLQNIPIRSELGKKIRSAFVPRRGNLLMDADYSQVELRILAHISGDKNLINAFREGADIHSRTAAMVYQLEEENITDEMRAVAKTINFGVIYGLGPRGLSKQIGVTVEEASEFIENYFDKYPGVRKFTEEYKEKARQTGYAETIFGRRRELRDISSENGRLRSFSERIAVNMPIQGTAADMIKIAMVNIDKLLREEKLDSRMILQVHDELIFEVPPQEEDMMLEIVRGEMESAVELKVPLKVSIHTGNNWLEAH
ncbi:MAG: DNA polymerase I [Candidatus Krumholzibacteriota bacterium]|nr:DNA polymerase I [Candidatus Krumholzibacteriota bacterium]